MRKIERAGPRRSGRDAWASAGSGTIFILHVNAHQETSTTQQALKQPGRKNDLASCHQPASVIGQPYADTMGAWRSSQGGEGGVYACTQQPGPPLTKASLAMLLLNAQRASHRVQHQIPSRWPSLEEGWQGDVNETLSSWNSQWFISTKTDIYSGYIFAFLACRPAPGTTLRASGVFNSLTRDAE